MTPQHYALAYAICRDLPTDYQVWSILRAFTLPVPRQTVKVPSHGLKHFCATLC